MPATDISSMQLWMPADGSAVLYAQRYHDIELTREDVEPMCSRSIRHRNKINIMNYAGGCTFAASDEDHVPEHYADDRSPIEAIEFRSTAALLDATEDVATKMGELAVLHSFEDAGDHRKHRVPKPQTAMVFAAAAPCYRSGSRKRGASEGAQSGALFRASACGLAMV